MRVFPLSNWTELDVWQYIEAERIDVVPLYFAKERPVVKRSGTWIMVDDDRLPLEAGETPDMRRVRFRTLGCYPLSGAIESEAATVGDIVAELRQASRSERQGRLIDSDSDASMERKKREGYF
jgi:sulfate adenylyltransferase subunit 2